MSNEMTTCGNCGLPIGEHSTYAGSLLVCQQCSYYHTGWHGMSFMAAYALGVRRGREAGMTEAGHDTARDAKKSHPTPKHIKEAQRLAAETESAIIAILSPEMGSNEIYAQILKHIPLATLLAAQEKLGISNNQIDALSNLLANIADTLRVRGFTGPKALDERVIQMAQALDQLRAELAMANDAADKGKAGRELGTALEEAVKENAELRAERDEWKSQVSLLNDSSATAHSYLELLGQLSELLASLKAEGETNDTMKKAYESMRCRWKLALTGYSERNEIIERLQTHNAALLAVARVAADVTIYTNVPHHYFMRLKDALSTLEPLGIKV